MDTPDYAALDKKRSLAIALKRQLSLNLRECFDPIDPKSRPTEQQLEFLKGIKDNLYLYLLGGNQSGKSACGGRTVSWFYQRNHPYLDVNKLWPDEPLIILVVGRLTNQVEELWERKIKPYLEPGEWRENRQGGSLQYAHNPRNGSKIIFASHANPNEAREKLQSYSAHLVWLDELTDHLGIIEELQRRVQAKRGRMMVTFTPKIRAEAVRKFIETPTAYSKLYRISMLDNPIYAERKEEVLSQINALPEAQRNTILYGDWYVGELAVYCFDAAKHLENPTNYSVLWPHVVSVDPAASGLMGFTLWAAPHDRAHRWYCVRAEYLRGQAPSDLVDLVEAKLLGLPNILRRISDSHESWFIKQAAKLKVTYQGIPYKKDRKKELIAQANQALANGRIRLTSECADLVSELQSAQWSETVEDRIVAASSYHLADTLQYFVDMMPRANEIPPEQLSYDTQLYLANKKRQAKEAQREALRRGGGTKQTWRIVAKGGRSKWRR